MTPKDFSFKLTVPLDPEGATMVAIVATHAVEYCGIEGAAGAAFVDRARAAALKAIKGGASERGGCLAVIAAANGQLTVTMGGESVSQPLPA